MDPGGLRTRLHLVHVPHRPGLAHNFRRMLTLETTRRRGDCGRSRGASAGPDNVHDAISLLGRDARQSRVLDRNSGLGAIIDQQFAVDVELFGKRKDTDFQTQVPRSENALTRQAAVPRQFINTASNSSRQAAEGSQPRFRSDVACSGLPAQPSAIPIRNPLSIEKLLPL